MTRGQPGPASLPVSRIDVGEADALGRARTATLGVPASARFMNCVQIGSAACAPDSPTGWLSSKPTQTTVRSSGVKPTNQASRRSLVVPVLPAASSVKPGAARAGAGAFVEDAAHHVGDEVRRVGPRDRPSAGCAASASTSFAPARSLQDAAAAGAPSPMFGKIVYAVAISNGVASNTPSAIDGYAFGALPTPSFVHSAATWS